MGHRLGRRPRQLTPASDELIRQAAQGECVHNDDTTVKILELMHAKRTQTSAIR